MALDKSYSTLITIPDYYQRFNYLKMNGEVGFQTLEATAISIKLSTTLRNGKSSDAVSSYAMAATIWLTQTFQSKGKSTYTI